MPFCSYLCCLHPALLFGCGAGPGSPPVNYPRQGQKFTSLQVRHTSCACPVLIPAPVGGQEWSVSIAIANSIYLCVLVNYKTLGSTNRWIWNMSTLYLTSRHAFTCGDQKVNNTWRKSLSGWTRTICRTGANMLHFWLCVCVRMHINDILNKLQSNH